MAFGRETLAFWFISPLEGKNGLSSFAFSFEDESVKNYGKYVRAEVILSGMVLEKFLKEAKLLFISMFILKEIIFQLCYLTKDLLKEDSFWIK